jgi:hypothetical protein
MMKLYPIPAMHFERSFQGAWQFSLRFALYAALPIAGVVFSFWGTVHSRRADAVLGVRISVLGGIISIVEWIIGSLWLLEGRGF